MSLISISLVLQEQPLTILVFTSYTLTNLDEGNLLYCISRSSGGYAETIFRYASKNLFGKEIVGPLNFKTIRNPNFQEVTLEVSLSICHICSINSQEWEDWVLSNI